LLTVDSTGAATGNAEANDAADDTSVTLPAGSAEDADTPPRRPEAHRKEHTLERIDDPGKRLACRQVTPAGFEGALLHFAPVLAHCLKRLNDIVNVKYSHSQRSPS